MTEWNTPAAGPAFTAGLVLYAAWPPLLAAAALHGLDEQRLERPAARVADGGLRQRGRRARPGVRGRVRPGRAGLRQHCPANLLLLTDAPAVGHTARAGRTRADGGLDSWRSPCSHSPGWSAPRRPGAGGRHRSSSRPSPPCCCGGPTPSTDSSAASSPTTRRTEPCGWRRPARSCSWPSAWLWPGCGHGAPGRALAQLVLDIGAAPEPGEVSAWLADSLGDPTIALLYRLEGGEWIDAEGRETALPPLARGRSTRVRVAGQDVFAVVTGAGCSTTPRSSPSW